MINLNKTKTQMFLWNENPMLDFAYWRIFTPYLDYNINARITDIAQTAASVPWRFILCALWIYITQNIALIITR